MKYKNLLYFLLQNQFTNQLLSSKQKGDNFEFRIIELLKKNGINSNAVRTEYTINNSKKFLGDGGVDIFGNSKSFPFIIQCKFKTDTTAFIPISNIREFIGTLSKQSSDCVGIFVTNALYSTRTQNEANNSRYKIYLTTETKLIETINKIEKNENCQNQQYMNIKLNIENGEFNFLNLNVKGQAIIEINNFIKN
jgi:hypothetical protein